MKKCIIASALLLTAFTPFAHAADDETAATAITAPKITLSARVAAVPETRPSILPALYVSLAGLQAYDIYSTRAGLARGGAELNPVVAPFAGDTGGMIALKALSTGTTIMLAERLWHRNRTAAILTMVAANGVMAAVAANNAHVLQQVR